jgi:hypothetical protein
MRVLVCRVLPLKLMVLLLVLSGCRDKEQTTPFLAGSAMVEITPSTGYPSYRGESTGVKTPLYARALVFRQGDIRGALLVCDVLSIPRDLSRIVREQASSRTGIPFRHISVTATHTHTGPKFRTAVEEYADRESAGELSTEDAEGYIARLIEGMTEAVVRADRQAEEVEIIAGIGRAEGISFNRRFLMSSGRVRFNPPYMDPGMIHPVGPVDPDVHFLMMRHAGHDEIKTSLAVFANHLDTQGGTEFHADYPWYLQEGLRETYGEQLVSVFGTGTCGNLNHCERTAPRPDEKKTEMIGRTLAEAIREAFPEGTRLKPDLRVDSKILYLPLQDYTEKEYQWAAEPDAPPLYPERTFLENVRRSKILSLEKIRRREAVPPVVSGDPWSYPVEIHAFRLDPGTAIVTMPGEVFVELGLELKKQSPFDNTMVVQLANADIIYVPTKIAFSEGGYEPLNTRLAPGSGERIIEEALAMLNEMVP